MRLTKYGISLESITNDDLEMIRNWRNADHVRLNMMYQDYITPEMQQNWFSNLNPDTNLYFIIIQNSEKIGIVNLKEINWQSKQAEAGIFIGEEKYLNSLSPILATICIMEYAFEDLKLTSLKAKILVNNVKAILFNESIGYKKQSEQSTADFHYYETNEVQFRSAIRNIRTILDKLK